MVDLFLAILKKENFASSQNGRNNLGLGSIRIIVN